MKREEALNKILSSIVKNVKWLIAVVAIFILFSGVTFVNQNEVAIIVRLGKLVGSNSAEQVKAPGLHFAFPYFIDKVIRVPVGKVQQLEINTLCPSFTAADYVVSGYAVTGDQNIVLIDSVIKYRIIDPVEYALNVKDMNSTLKGILTGTLVRELSSTSVDSILTVKKSEIGAAVVQSAQEEINKLSLGILLSNLEFTSVTPPEEVKAAFDGVTTASVQKETLIKNANRYRESELPKAAAEAEKAVNDAKSNYESLTVKAKNDVAEFYGLLDQYRKNPGVVMDRVYRDKVTKILQNTGAKIIVPEDGKSGKIILP